MEGVVMLSRVTIRKYLFLGLAIQLSAMVCATNAAFWNVPQDGTIQDVISNDANSGDVITVSGSKTPADPNIYVYSGPGYYDIDFQGKNVTLQAGGFRPWSVVIDCCSLGRAFIFQSGENNAILDGFVIRNGYAEDPTWPNEPNVSTSGYGGAIYCKNSTPTIQNCIITDCVADSGGGAIFCDVDGDARIFDCTISFNYAGYGFYKYGVNPYDANVANLKLRGGGIYCKDSSPTIMRVLTSCEISWNRVAGAGGGIACENSYASISGCDIFENDAWVNNDDIIQHGGGVYCERGSPLIYRSHIIWNDAARGSGGGVAVVDGNGVWIDECEITDNHAWASGSGIYSQGSADPNEPNDPNIPKTPTCNVRKCLIADNVGYWCGGVASDYGSFADVNSCTIANNVASWSHGPCLVGGLECYYGGAKVRSSIIWGNTGLQISYTDPNAVTVTYSDVQMTDPNCFIDPDPTNVWQGEGNMNKDPCFANPIRRDYHLKTEYPDGRWNPETGQFDAHDTSTSPCINAGDPFADYSFEPAPNGNRVNMGAYGGTPQASMSDIPGPTPGSVVGGTTVNMMDFAALANNWLSQGEDIRNRKADLDNDRAVDKNDLGILTKFWLWQQ